MKRFLTHYIVLAVIQFALTLCFNLIVGLWSTLIATFITCNLIYWKERYDDIKVNPTGFSRKDIIKGIGGIITGSFLAVLVLMILQ